MKKLSRKYKMALASCILMMAIAFLVYYNVSRSEKENPVALQQICMVSAQTGWALTSDNELLYTDNGIDEFCTVKKLQATENYAHLCVMNGTTVYLAYFSEENIVVEYSLDMGAEWKTTRIPYREYGDANTVFINFADEQNGYLLYCSTPGAGQMTKILFQTTDGGESFEKISDLSDVISGYPTGLAYSTSSCGYISTTYHGEDKYLFYTADSGVTWRSIELEEYEIENFSYVEAYPPVFFGEANLEGKIILKYVGAEKNSYVEYITEDGGATWEKGNLLDCDNIANYSYFGEGGYWINAEGVPKELEIVQATETERESDTESDLINTGENTGNEILRRLMTADLSFAEEATITGDWDSVVRLAELPEYDITMYGYNDEEISGRGVAIQIGDDVNYFDWVYIAPRCILPEMYWDDAKKQLQVALNIYTGTGVSAQELHILQQYETGTLSDSVLDIRNYSELLAERLEYAYDKETNSLTILDKRDGGKLFQTTLPYADGEAVVGICAGDISNFILGDELWLEFTPGYCLEGRVSIEYEGMVPLKAQILLESIEENRFTSGKMYHSQLAEFFENPLYQELLNQLDNQGILPDGRLAYGTTNLEGLDPFPNSIAFADVDNDGGEELLISVGGSCMADMGLYVYQCEEEEQKFREELVAWNGTMFYTNGVAKEPASHNHGYSCNEDFWPYTLYAYNMEKDEYQRVMRVDAWEKAFYPKDYDGNEFPDTLDEDGDGMVYLLYENEEDAPMILDNKAYKAWYREQIGNGKKFDIIYQNTDILRNN